MEEFFYIAEKWIDQGYRSLVVGDVKNKPYTGGVVAILLYYKMA